jgi:hypothetical protein
MPEYLARLVTWELVNIIRETKASPVSRMLFPVYPVYSSANRSLNRLESQIDSRQDSAKSS